MNNDEAIRKLQKQKAEYLEEWVDYSGVAEAYDMAIEALSERTGEWTYLSGSKGSYMTISCPICGSTFDNVAEWKYHYCPNCGADMRGENK